MKLGIILVIFTAALFSTVSQAKFLNFGRDTVEYVDYATYEMERYEFTSVLSDFMTAFKDVLEAIHDVRDLIPKDNTETIKVMEMFSQIDLGPICTSCQNAVLAMRAFSDQAILKDLIENFANGICLKKMNQTVCNDAIQRYGDVVFNVLINRTFDAIHVCEKVFLCHRTTHKEKLDDFVKEVLADKPATNIPVPTKRSTYKILHLTDPHIDLDYQEGMSANCDQPLCCRPAVGPATNASDAAQYWGTVASCDIPMRTFDQFLQFASSNFDIDMIIWTGDNIQHNIWEQDVANQTLNTYDATQEILKYFPNTTIYPMFGNHEAFPCDQFDFVGNNSAWLTSRLSEMWKVWLDDDALATFVNTSYYAMVDTEHNVKIIALDTVACDNLDFYLIENPTDPNNMLAWLRAQLYDSESKNQGVIIMGHIPPGDFGCDSEWSFRYRALVDRFTNTIRAQLFGHTHNDQLEIVRSYSDNSAVGVVFIAPSMTTYSDLHPSFRIFEIDSDTNVLINYYQYRLDLDKWNQNTTGPIEWDLAYDVLSEYNLANMTYAAFDSLASEFLQDNDLVQTYYNNFYAGGTNKKLSDITPSDVAHAYCEAKHSVSENSFECLGLNATTSDLMDLASQILPGGWSFTHC